MDYIELIIGAIGLGIAVWALNLQRREIIKNGQINSLIHTASLIQERIDFHSRIIENKKAEGKGYDEWRGHAAKINEVLRPLKAKVDNEFLDLSAKYDGVMHEEEIRNALRAKQNDAA